MTGAILVVNMRGTANIPHPVKKTLHQLKVLRRYSATLVPDTASYRGMLQRTANHLSWSEIDQKFLTKLLEKRGRKVGDLPIQKSDLKSFGYKTMHTMTKELTQGKIKLSDIKTLKPYFRLHPPRGGLKRSIRRAFTDGGILGENPDLLKIVDRML